MDELLHHLRNLGFTEMEAKVMVELAKQGALSGYEVAKRIGVSRSNVYATLQRLSSQGFLRCSPGDPVRYSVLQPDELTRMIAGHMQESLRYVEEAMPQPGPSELPFYNIEGDKNVLETLVRALDRAKREIVVSVWREEASMLREDLERAEERGVKVLWSCDGGDNYLRHFIPWQHDTLKEDTPAGRRFSFVVDRQWCMLGMRGDNISAQAVVTEHPVMAELLLQHFTQEMVLFELEQDIGTDLFERYGANYEKLVRKYVSHGDEH
ncbi:TrmB family transcriptional regulator [Paenibacillus sediminis]|uniref:Sugar-specific transcriptional regulator TrmB n=1 Tax=Paenibacillus sediminis TaxID=664909 RepID=A0ABS4H861_9BACL|nr:TrmB family transcriptional regulator [Paenibacillus sediminis]MBP1938547.1 sugar-specific transcriptional regulator TrmB [Paenibacillus sediminis]